MEKEPWYMTDTAIKYIFGLLGAITVASGIGVVSYKWGRMNGSQEVRNIYEQRVAELEASNDLRMRRINEALEDILKRDSNNALKSMREKDAPASESKQGDF